MYKVFLVFLVLASQSIFGNDGELSGQVLDGGYDNQPLAFASVKVKGLDIETITDEEGYFQLDLVPGSYTLEIEFIGYEKIEVSTNLSNEGRTQLEPIALQMRKRNTESDLVEKVLNEADLSPGSK